MVIGGNSRPGTDDLFCPGPSATAREYLFKAAFTHDKTEVSDRMARYITPGTAVIDVGAHVGYFSRRFADHNPTGLVLAFEPQSVPRSIATVASFFRRQRNIVQFPMALGSAPGLVELKIPIKSKGKIGIGLAHVGHADDLGDRFRIKREVVPRDTLDNVLARVAPGPVSMVKIDVEGGELDVLRGAVDLLARDRPVVVCETGALLGRFGDSLEDLWSFTSERGYDALDLISEKPVGPGDRSIDTVFRPRKG